MQKIKTSFFWKIFLIDFLGFILLRSLVQLYLEESFTAEYWRSTIFHGAILGVFLAFYIKPKPKRITEFNEVR